MATTQPRLDQIRSAFMVFDEALKEITQTGADDGAATASYEWLNNSLNRIMAIFNDQHVEFGGSTFVISVLSAIASGAAYIEMNDNYADGFSIKDKAGNNFVTFTSTTGALSLTFRQRVGHNQNVGFTKWQVQAYVRTSTTAGAANLVSFVDIPTDQAVAIEVNHLFAYATDASVVMAVGNKEAVVRNVAGTVTAGVPAFTVAADPATTATWAIAADDTNNRANINFSNTTGTGKTFDCFLDYSYILTALPV